MISLGKVFALAFAMGILYNTQMNFNGPNLQSSNTITVHLVPHSHDDLGWLSTVDEYYSNAVKSILTSSIAALEENKERKFVYAEMRFFKMWWMEQTEDKKQKVKSLIKSGQLEIVNGGWSMPDEACPTYDDLINNFRLGHQFAKEELGTIPKIGWQLDPFGHTAGFAKIVSDLGYEALYLGRIDTQEIEKRGRMKELEFLWYPFSENQQDKNEIFTHIPLEKYLEPSEFDFGSSYQHITPSTATRVAESFYNYLKDRMIPPYRTNHVLKLIGNDFAYQRGEQSFQQFDLLIETFNRQYSDIQIQYSTPSEYFRAIHDMNLEWTKNYADFLPYNDVEVRDHYVPEFDGQSGKSRQGQNYWSGFYTTRPVLKNAIKYTSALIQGAQNLFSKYLIENGSAQYQSIANTLFEVEEYVGVLQHHDAITGTSPKKTASDYLQKITEKVNDFGLKVSAWMKDYVQDLSGQEIQWEVCKLSYGQIEEVCPIEKMKDKASFQMMVCNPSVQPKNYIEFELQESGYEALIFQESDQKYTQVEQVVFKDGERVKMLIEYQINPLSCALLNIQKSDSQTVHQLQPIIDNTQIENQFESLTFLSVQDQLPNFQLTDKETNQISNFKLDIRYYLAGQGYVARSDHYVFEAGGSQNSQRYSMLQSTSFLNTPLYSEFKLNYQAFSTSSMYDTITFKLYKLQKGIKFDLNLNSVELKSGNQGEEVIVKFISSDIQNSGVFYTDSNGLQMQKRVVNHRDNWEVYTNSVVASNYYPVTSAIAIRDEYQKRQMSVLTNRCQGGSSLANGEIEVMYNRRLRSYGNKGVTEAYEEIYYAQANLATITASGWILFHDYEQQESSQRKIQIAEEQPLMKFYSFNKMESALNLNKQVSNSKKMSDFEITDKFKVTIIPERENSFLMRVANLEDAFDLKAQKQVSINIPGLFAAMTQIEATQISVQEVNLAGSELKSETLSRKLTWANKSGNQIESGPEFKFENMEIRQFRISLTKKVQDFLPIE